VFVGHAFLAFGLAAVYARRYGSPERSLRLPGGVTVGSAVAVGLAAALFASLPDVDVVHAAFQVVTLPDGSTAVDHFWAATGQRHRTTTHSLLVALAASVGFALLPVRRRVAVTVLAGVVALATLSGGVVGGAVMALFVAGGVGIVALAVRTGLGARSLLVASAIGLAVHPFTDLLTGEPPAFFAPLEVLPVGGRIEPFADATVNLLLAFGTELAVIWFGVVVGAILLGIDPRRYVHPGAVLGVAYAPMAFVLEGPSVDNATPFVATILPMGVLGVVGLRRPWSRRRVATVLLTGLGAITAAWIAFGLSYVLVAS